MIMRMTFMLAVIFAIQPNLNAQLTQRLISADTLKTYDLTFDFDGERMAAITQKRVLIWNTENYELAINRQTPAKQLTSVVFHPTRELIFVADLAGNVYQINLEEEKEKPEVVYKHENSIRKILFDRSGEFLYIADASGLLSKINIYNWEVEKSAEANEGEVSDMAIDNQSELIFTCGEDGFVKIYKLDSLYEVTSIKSSRDWLRRLSLDRFKKLLVTGGDSGKLHVYSYGENKIDKITAIPQGHHNWITGLDFHPIGVYLASAGHDNRVVIRRVPSDEKSLEALKKLNFPKFKAPIHNFVGEYYPVDLTFQPTTSNFAVATLGKGIYLFSYEVVSKAP